MNAFADQLDGRHRLPGAKAIPLPETLIYRVVLDVFHKFGARGLDLRASMLGPPPLGHGFDRQQDPFTVLMREPASVEQHHLAPDAGEVVLELEIAERGVAR